MAFGRLSEGDSAPNAEINMIPLIDVMLVLLVIFIITAPIMTQSVKLKLPEATSLSEQVEKPIEQKPTFIAINATQEIYINEEKVELEMLSHNLRLLKESLNGQQPIIQLHIDASVPYEYVAKLLTELSSVGLVNIGFVSLPEETQK